MKIDQMQLIRAILAEVDRQHPKAGATTAQVNRVIEAADLIIAEFKRDPVWATPGMGLDAWLASDDTGLSSKAMAHHLAGGKCPINDILHYPHDATDFGRCHRFLEAVPEARPTVGRMATLSPAWDRLALQWTQLTDLYLAGKTTELTDTIRRLIA